MLPHAAAANDLDAMRRILDRPEGISAASIQVAMIFASRAGQIEAMALLLQHGADLNSEPIGTDYLDLTPLTEAALHGQVASVKFLIEQGANVNYAPQSTGYTPLWCAIDYEADTASQVEETPRMEASALLYEAGADPHICDTRCLSALDLARVYKYQEAIQRFTT